MKEGRSKRKYGVAHPDMRKDTVVGGMWMIWDRRSLNKEKNKMSYPTKISRLFATSRPRVRIRNPDSLSVRRVVIRNSGLQQRLFRAIRSPQDSHQRVVIRHSSNLWATTTIISRNNSNKWRRQPMMMIEDFHQTQRRSTIHNIVSLPFSVAKTAFASILLTWASRIGL